MSTLMHIVLIIGINISYNINFHWFHDTSRFKNLALRRYGKWRSIWTRRLSFHGDLVYLGHERFYTEIRESFEKIYANDITVSMRGFIVFRKHVKHVYYINLSLSPHAIKTIILVYDCGTLLNENHHVVIAEISCWIEWCIIKCLYSLVIPSFLGMYVH